MARPKGYLLHPPAFRYLLGLKGLTQKDVADRSGVKPTTISNLCKQSSRASASTAQRLAVGVDCPAEVLFPEMPGQFAVAADLVPA